jgi:hypothetical protein
MAREGNRQQNSASGLSVRKSPQTAVICKVSACQETNASIRPMELVTLAKARVQKSRGRMGIFAVPDARFREHDEVSFDSLIP